MSKQVAGSLKGVNEAISSHQYVRTSLEDAEQSLRPVIGWGLFFSFLITVLGFSGPLYMMNLYSRVINSRNETTMIVLTIIVLFAIAVEAILETVRADMLRRASVGFDQKIAGDTFDAVQKAIVRRPMDRNLPTMADVDALRNFINGSALPGLLMLPFFPLFLIVCWIIHPAFVALVVVTGGAMAVINYMTSRVTAEPVREFGKAQQAATKRANAAFQNYESVHSMGMRPAMRGGWQRAHRNAMHWSIAADDRSTFLRILGSFTRNLGNTLVLALAAYLVLNNSLDAAMIFATSIIVGQATAPLQGLVRSWRSIAAARQARARLQSLLQETAAEAPRMRLPAPKGDLAVYDVAIAPPGKGVESILLRNISFSVPAGSILAVVGPSASGKSSLARALIGVWKPLRGIIRIDGTDIDNWNDEDLGAHLGYLPQNVELFPGTVAENICRFSDADSAQIIKAATNAGIHAMIQALPHGYDTRIGEQGQGLSGGQRQRIGLARALFGDPAIVVLDEPNSNLDGAGEEILSKAMQAVRARGATVVLVTHKASILSIADFVVVLGEGVMKDFGPCDEVSRRFTKPKVINIRPPQLNAAPGVAGPRR
ncbi:type I secretion system permease/ATPase [Tianweitania sediminis]|uniref:Type I secretion system permease/ATPase n=1 Tax=Tianweitania sediminis TaxID=1502156 RepID=A0A8J7UKN3_9HYPH|nr:type I secretion system permease/ATPase [Tianweitania sediminis]MBP0438517.1 type I secretion system permease/ATPase [Tianweitania sediminis]